MQSKKKQKLREQSHKHLFKLSQLLYILSVEDAMLFVDVGGPAEAQIMLQS